MSKLSELLGEIPVEETIKYIPKDPVTWLERLMEVNQASEFSRKDKIIIHAHLYALQKLLKEK